MRPACDHRTFSEEVLAQAREKFPEELTHLWGSLRCSHSEGHEGLHWLRRDFGSGGLLACWEEDGELVNLPHLVQQALAELEEITGRLTTEQLRTQ